MVNVNLHWGDFLTLIGYFVIIIGKNRLYILRQKNKNICKHFFRFTKDLEYGFDFDFFK
jgi:hypothetical protein